MLNLDKNLKFWIKQSLIIFIPFIVIYFNIKKSYSKKIAIISSIISLIIFILFWHSILIDETLKQQNKELKSEINDKDLKIILLNEKIKETNKPTPPTKTPIKEKKKVTLAQKAYKKLNNDNMLNEPYIVAISVIEEIEENYTMPEAEIFHDNIWKKYYRWEQRFEFSDKSKIALFKKQNENKEFIFCPYQTKILK
jgi:hypothetical protein